jgi:hypothetical protein
MALAQGASQQRGGDPGTDAGEARLNREVVQPNLAAKDLF